MEIRAFASSDAEAIEKLFVNVFTDSGGAAEGAMVGQLSRQMMADTAKADLYGFVALDRARIVGAVLFSRLTCDSGIDVFILAPMAVHPDYQRQGTGSALIRHGLGELRAEGVSVVTTYGDPAYYRRLGFEPLSTQTLAPPFELSQPIGWLGQSLTGAPIEPIAGRCTCVEALCDPAYW